MEVIKQEECKARKKHYCNFCHEEIRPGEKYNYSFLKTEKKHMNGSLTRVVNL